MNTEIFTITTLYVIPAGAKNLDDIDWKKYKNRTVGFYFTLEKAEECVRKDWGDLDEAGYYNYLVIERLREGLYPSVSLNPDHQLWFKHDRTEDKWVKTEKPECLSNIVGFGIG